jgi:ketosteroid isomerase-like protein
MKTEPTVDLEWDCGGREKRRWGHGTMAFLPIGATSLECLERAHMNEIDIVAEYFDAWNEHSAALIVKCFQSGGVYIDPNVPDGVKGRDIGAFADSLFAALPDLHLDIVSRSPLGDGRVMVEWLLRASPGISLPGVDLIELDAGKIVLVRGYYDRLTLDQQLKKAAH